MGDYFSSLSKHLVGRPLNIIMKFIVILSFFALTQAFVVRRDAEAEADAEADADGFGIGYGASPRAVSTPVCKSVPQKVCKDTLVVLFLVVQLLLDIPHFLFQELLVLVLPLLLLKVVELNLNRQFRAQN